MQIKVSYITANEIMEILGIGRSKAYDIVREMNQELENAGYNVIKGKVPVRYFQKKHEFFVEDLKRYNIRALLIDEYSEITDIYDV